MLSRDPTWITYLAATAADLKAAAPPVRQAPTITVATIVALELYVISSDEPAYLRGIAWIALLMVYCSLRTDDAQGILPNSCVLSNLGFKAVLGRTKTTGADRRNHLVLIFIERGIFRKPLLAVINEISDPRWPRAPMCDFQPTAELCPILVTVAQGAAAPAAKNLEPDIGIHHTTEVFHHREVSLANEARQQNCIFLTILPLHGCPLRIVDVTS